MAGIGPESLLFRPKCAEICSLSKPNRSLPLHLLLTVSLTVGSDEFLLLKGVLLRELMSVDGVIKRS